MMGGKWPYSCCFVGCCSHDLFNIARSILVLLPSSFFSICFVSVHVVRPYSSIDTTWALLTDAFFSWKSNDGSFHVSEHCQRDLLYWPQHPEPFFTKKSVCFHFMNCLFWLRLFSGKPMFSHFVNILWLKYPSPYTSRFFCKFHVLRFKFDGRPLKPLAVCLICHHFE